MPQELLPYDNPMQDRRRKIHPEDHTQIKRDYQEMQSQRKVAEKWGVSKRLISFILNPEKLKRQKELFKKRRLDGRYYDPEKHKYAMRSIRKRKKQLKLTNSKYQVKPLNAEPIPEGYMTARRAANKYHAHQNTIKKYLKPYHFPKSWNYPLYKITELEEWNKNHRTEHQLSRIKK